MYPSELIAPMIEDLTSVGVKELKTSNEVKEILEQKEGTTLVVVNSVCGCAAANARPAIKIALKNEKLPHNITTVFAGVDKDATEEARKFFMPYPPSSPSMGLFKNGELVHFIERHQIEGRPAEIIAHSLVAAFDEHC